MASGMPSSARQIVVTAATLSGPTVNPGREAAARSANSRTASYRCASPVAAGAPLTPSFPGGPIPPHPPSGPTTPPLPPAGAAARRDAGLAAAARGAQGERAASAPRLTQLCEVSRPAHEAVLLLGQMSLDRVHDVSAGHGDHPQGKPEGPIPVGNGRNSRMVNRRGGLSLPPGTHLAATIKRSGPAHSSPRLKRMPSPSGPHRSDYVARYVMCPGRRWLAAGAVAVRGGVWSRWRARRRGSRGWRRGWWGRRCAGCV